MWLKVSLILFLMLAFLLYQAVLVTKGATFNGYILVWLTGSFVLQYLVFRFETPVENFIFSALSMLLLSFTCPYSRMTCARCIQMYALVCLLLLGFLDTLDLEPSGVLWGYIGLLVTFLATNQLKCRFSVANTLFVWFMFALTLLLLDARIMFYITLRCWYRAYVGVVRFLGRKEN